MQSLVAPHREAYYPVGFDLTTSATAMPANLPPQYVKLEEEYRREKDLNRRLELLQRMWGELPKHKGTDHLQGELKAKISKLKAQLEGTHHAGGTRHAALDHIPREGAGQFVLFGPPNSGKSSILAALTNAHAEVTSWPFATRKPQPGMASWDNVQIQLVDTPSIAPEFCEPYVFNIIRAGDVAVLVLSLGNDNLLDELDFVVNRVHEGKVRLDGLAAFDARWPTALPRPCAIAATSSDFPDADSRLALLRERAGERVPVWPMSVTQRQGLTEFLAGCFAMLDLMRVYTRAPGRPPDLTDPILLPHGGTVADAARVIHKDFAQKLQFARIWSRSRPALDGQRVTGDHLLEEGDILEFHA